MGDTDVDYPSLWAWPEIEFLMNLLGLKKWEFDQGPLGHPRRKPTCILSNRDPPEGKLARTLHCAERGGG